VPILLQILSGAKKAQDLVPAGSIYGLNRGDVVELTIPAGAAGGPVSRSPIMSFKLCDVNVTIASRPSSWPFFLCRSQCREQLL
jgi:hypothetical protein